MNGNYTKRGYVMSDEDKELLEKCWIIHLMAQEVIRLNGGHDIKFVKEDKYDKKTY